MLDVGSRPKSSVGQSHPIAHIDEEASDWELVLRESHHRMKNTLTLLGASVRRELTRAGPGDVSIVVDRFERRLVAFGRLYQLLSDDAGRKTVPIAAFFESLCGALSDAILEPSGIRCEAAIESGSLPASQCHRLALILTELVTNAAKHAFPNRDGGMVRVVIACRGGSWWFTVEDNGIGATGPLQGTGGRILESLVRTIQARVHGETGRGGTRVTVMMPVLGCRAAA